MIRISKAVNRRTFLKNGLSFFVANLFSLPLSNAFASSRACFIPRLAIIIDDIGFSRSRAELFLQPEIPLTFSILPRLSKSRALAEELHAQGHEIMLHQPMEPSGSIHDPGPGAVYVGDDPEIITGQIRKNIADTPFITGVNNHMGSKFTACSKEMTNALTTIRERGLFFIDSLTTGSSTGFQTARELGMTAARRNLFLDLQRDEKAILAQLRSLKARAEKQGYAIGIGHPYKETARAITLFKKDIHESGVSMVHISDLFS
ncbi:MAG: divergent polysaccharide deacetylase family protein [Deltaproteobacteria bacterium]|nr:divergent polysaccharide deacetylase family protein [Deltaproteobacteria bacterium]